jgi:zinc transport system substrate-binding protein
MAELRGKPFVVFHDAYQYFEVAFDIPSAGAIRLGDATDPSPGRIAEIQAEIRENGITCALAEPQFNETLLATVMDGSEAKVGVIDPLGAQLTPGPDLYPALIENMLASLQDCIS